MRGCESDETYGKDGESSRSFIWSDLQMEKNDNLMTPNLPFSDSKLENLTVLFYLLSIENTHIFS